MIEKLTWDNIYSLQLGNEPDTYPGLGGRSEGYSPKEYAPEWAKTAEKITKHPWQFLEMQYRMPPIAAPEATSLG